MKNIFNNKSNDRKRINNYLNFLNKTNGQTCLKKSTTLNILGFRESFVSIFKLLQSSDSVKVISNFPEKKKQSQIVLAHMHGSDMRDYLPSQLGHPQCVP